MKRTLITALTALTVVLGAANNRNCVWDMLSAAMRQKPAENVLLSPLSLQQCLGMLICGMPENNEISSLLGVDRITAAAMQAAIKSFPGEKREFNIFNAVFFNRNIKVKEKFVRDVNTFFGGKAYRVDFNRKSEVVETLNDIVKHHSRNMFDAIFKESDIAGNPAMMLLNILYFKSAWQLPFDRNLTQKRDFTPADGKSIKVNMMEQKAYLPYYQDDKVSAILLPYYGGRFQLLAAMPTGKDKPLSVVVEELKSKNLLTFTQKFNDSNETVCRIPVLNLETDSDMIPLLKSAGLKQTLIPSGSFSGITDAPLGIDQVRQLVKLKLDESGTEMAAVTYAIARCALRPPQSKINYFYADRPFVIVLFDRESGLILLTGIVNHP